jgi:hypothetical protein
MMAQMKKVSRSCLSIPIGTEEAKKQFYPTVPLNEIIETLILIQLPCEHTAWGQMNLKRGWNGIKE